MGAILKPQFDSPMPMNMAANMGDLQRISPHSHEAEQALLGALLHNNMAFERVAEFLKPEHFSDPSHSRIYEAITTLLSRCISQTLLP